MPQSASLEPQESFAQEACVLMFSGGRDSTLAALRLIGRGYNPTLVTISSTHLFGIDAVRQRLREMKQYLPAETLWLTIKQPLDLKVDTAFYEQTCLPCHHAYAVTGAKVALAMGSHRLAFGYAGYQNTWPEQTPLAVARLTAALSSIGVELVLPVYDLPSREAAIDQLTTLGLSATSLEQKCLQQIKNLQLPESKLIEQISLWESAILESAKSLGSIELTTLSSMTLADL